jgi:alpha-mannosidase
LQTDEEAKDAGSALDSDVLENEVYRVKVDRATGRIEVFDKELSRAVAKDIEITASEERGGDGQNKVLPTGRSMANVISSVELEESGPVQSVLRVTGRVAGIPIVQRLTLFRGLKKIDIEDRVDWKPGVAMHLQQVFPLPRKDMAIRYGTPFGSVTPSDVMPGAQPYNDDELTPEIWRTWRQIQEWIFAGNSDWGFTLAADHQLMIVDDTAIRASMLRGPRFNPTKVVRNGQTLLSPGPPAATYVFRYSFSSGKGDWTGQQSWRAGMTLSSPLIPVMSADTVSQKPLPPEQSFVSLKADNLVITALKKADQDGNLVLRVFEIKGVVAESPIQFFGENRGFSPVNLLEEDLGSGEQTVLHIQPNEISTVKLHIR